MEPGRNPARPSGVKKNAQVTYSVDNDDKNRCVDIIQSPDCTFRFQEWRREPEDLSGWFLLRDSLPATYKSESEAIVAAKRAITWFENLNSSGA